MTYRRPLAITKKEMENLHIPARYQERYKLECFTQGMFSTVDETLRIIEELGSAEHKLSEKLV
jgi:hypothetical protein